MSSTVGSGIEGSQMGTRAQRRCWPGMGKKWVVVGGVVLIGTEEEDDSGGGG